MRRPRAAIRRRRTAYDAMTTQQGEGDTGQPEQKSIEDRANYVARAEAAVWLALQDIGIDDRIIVLNEVLRETLAKAAEREAAEPQTRKALVDQDIGQ
jgi:hypothetical protein